MNFGPLLFLGILLTLASSWFGLVLIPNQQLGALQPEVNPDTGVAFPQPIPGEAAQGRELYRSLGCNYCHTQQVRPDGFGADVQRGWGKRRSVSRDYIYQKPVMLGSSRTGPDLTNIGERQPSYDWHYTHLFNPQTTSKGSIMPPYAFLFETRRIDFEGSSTNALKLFGEFAPEPGWEVVPKPEATQLVEYLRSLKSSVDLPEAPLPKVE